MIAQKLIGALPRRIFASAPPGAVDAFEAANRRLRGRKGKKRGQKSVSSETTEQRFMSEIGAVAVPEILISKNMISAARNAARRASVELGTAEPEVRWFRVLRGGQASRGWFCSSFADVVWISAGLSTAKVPSVVRHESKHRADSLAGRAMTEKAADAFAARFDQPSDGRTWAPRPTTFLHPPLAGVWT